MGQVAAKDVDEGEWINVQSRQFDVTSEATSAPVPDDLIPLCDAATSAVRRGRWKKGETLWREFLAKAPAFHPGYHNLAVALIQQGRDGEAEKCLRKALELAPDYIFAHCTLAMLFLRRTDYTGFSASICVICGPPVWAMAAVSHRLRGLHIFCVTRGHGFQPCLLANPR